jgi:hypothetical protein
MRGKADLFAPRTRRGCPHAALRAAADSNKMARKARRAFPSRFALGRE